MANHKVLLIKRLLPLSRKWKKRRYRQGLIRFFEALALYLKAGFALSYSWAETFKTLESNLTEDLRCDLKGTSGEETDEFSATTTLKTLRDQCRIAPYRMWFGVLLELYETGAQLTQGVEAVVLSLRREQERELEAHCRSLPVKVNVVLMVFFLPPTFLWIFVPIVLEILSEFK